MRIALLDDDPAQLVQLLTALRAPFLEDEEISCMSFSHGESLRKALRRETFDALILDWNVPDLDGAALLMWMRKELNDDTPVLMLSSRASERDVASALKIGADDYVIKPFRPLELRARIQRLVGRRHAAPKRTTTQFGRWAFDGMNNTVTVAPAADVSDAEPVQTQLAEREFRLALILFQNLGKAVSRSYLLEKSGYASEEAPTRALDSQIYRLRKKLALDETNNLRLQTIYGHGYRLMQRSSEMDFSQS